MKIKNAVCYSYYLGFQDSIATVRLLGPLQRAGIHIINGIVNGQPVGELVRNGDIVVVQRDFPRRLDDYQRVIRIAKQERKPIVFDLDDLLLFLPENHPDRMTHYYAPSLLPMFQALMEADLLTVATPKLQSTLASYNKNIVVLPNYFDDALWQLRPPVLKSKDEILTIGYMGGDSHKPDIEFIQPVLLDLIKRYPHRIRFHFWGMQPPTEMLSLPQVESTSSYTYGYKEFSAFFQTQSADIFIAPLVDSLFNQCKSPLKFFEYSALGAPGVFSNIETYSEVVSHGKNGFLPSSLDEWTDCLIQLIENSELRFQLAFQAQATIRENWLLSQNASQWNKAYDRAFAIMNSNKKQDTEFMNILRSIDTQSFESYQALTADAAKREHLVQALTDQVAEKEQAAQLVMAQLVDKETASHALTAQLAEREQAMQALTAQFLEREQKVQVLMAQQSESERAVQALTTKMAEHEQSIQVLTAQLVERDQAAVIRTAQQAEREQAVQALTSQLTERERTIQALSAQLEELEKQLNGLAGQYREITGSKAWHVALLMRRLRIFLLPPESRRVQLARKLRPLLLFLFNLRRNFQINQDERLIRKSGLFDPDWYLANNPDVALARMDPLIHYVRFGGFEGRDPSPNFRSTWYLETNADVKIAGINPLVHYLKYGWKEGRNPLQENDIRHFLELDREFGYSVSDPLFKKSTSKTPINSILKQRKSKRKFYIFPPVEKLNSHPIESEFPRIYQNIYEQLLQPTKGKDALFVDYVPNEKMNLENRTKLIAFYLPQYHPIVENDRAWGKGFTEWTNVSRAIPQFTGHYQPHQPGELGYYDLRIPEVQERQVELAKNYGIYGFCFYYYWFNGKKLLDRPLNQFISNSNIDFPFCICWANENWTRKWDGRDDEIIIGQRHTNLKDKKFIEDVIPFFRDKRYIRINNQPLLVIYNVKILDNPSVLLNDWRRTCIESGVGDPFIVAAQTFEFYDPRDFGFDAAVMFPPHNVLHVPNLRDRIELANKDYDGEIYSYPDLIREIIERYKKEPYTHFKTVFPSWDNEPRRPGKGFSFIGSTPKEYEYFLKETCRFTKVNNSIDKQYVFINAWNEWAEGAHLEPDRKFGYAYLQATKDALQSYDRHDSEISNGFTGNDDQIINVGSDSINKYKQIYFKIQAENEGIFKRKELINLYSGDPNPNPDVSIIIPVHNHFDTTFNCLHSITRAKEKTSFEVIIIDDCSSDETAEVISACQGILYLRNDNNIGFLNSCNSAASQARGSYLLFLNNDTVVLPGWLDALVKTFADNKDAGLVGSKLIFPNGTMQEAGGIIWKDGSATNYGRGDDPDKPEYNYLREVDYCSGASIVIPASLWGKLNGFDRLYEPAYYEDDDLAFRVREAGYKVYYQPLSQIFHVEGATAGTDLSIGIKRFQELNQAKFYERWRKALESKGDISQPEFIYRDRFRNKRVLVIDVCTPKPDQDSGSIDTYNYLLSLRKLGFAVTFISVVDSNKVDGYVLDLLGKGICCQYAPYLSSIENYIKQFGYSFDLVFLFRAPFGGKYIEMVKAYAPKAKIVFNTVDLHFLREERQKNLSTDKNSLNQFEGISRDNELSIMCKADHTILVSEYEKSLINKIEPNIKVSVIPQPRGIPGRTNGFDGRRDILFIGGFLHKPNGDAVMNFVEKIWPLIRAEIPDCKFYIIGSNIPDGIKALEKHEGIVVIGFVQDLSEYFSNIRLTVSPLRFGAGVKGKIITSLSYGVPCVASPIATEGMELVDNLNILIGDSKHDFTDKVIKLYRSKELWERLSQNGLAYVNNKNSLEQFEKRLDKLISSLFFPN